MNTFSKTLTKLLPVLVLPAVLLASATAEAATLDISNGFITARTFTTSGWTFSLLGSGTVIHNGQSVPTSMVLDCEIDSSVEVLDCTGELKINGVAADILLLHDDGTTHWAIEAGAPTLFNDIHEQWGERVVTDVLDDGSGWDYVEFFDGTSWRRFYYFADWAGTWESITGLPYGEYLEIWTW